MESYLYGEIVPGERVGKFRLGWSLEKVKENIDFDYKIKDAPCGCILENECIRFFFDDKGFLDQIAVYGGYKGKFLGRIEIDSILAEAKDFLKYEMEKESNDFEYYLPDYPGIDFLLEGYSDDHTPIRLIAVYKCNATE